MFLFSCSNKSEYPPEAIATFISDCNQGIQSRVPAAQEESIDTTCKCLIDKIKLKYKYEDYLYIRNEKDYIPVPGKRNRDKTSPKREPTSQFPDEFKSCGWQ